MANSSFYWLCLAGSIVFEVAGTSVMKISQVSPLISPMVGMGSMYLLLALSYYCLAKAVMKLPLGVAYAFWEGFGLVLITLVSVLFLQERFDITRLGALALVLGGTLLVHHGTDSGHEEDAPNPESAASRAPGAALAAKGGRS